MSTVEFHGTEHNEKSHGRRGADEIEYVADRGSKFHEVVAKKNGEVVGRLTWSKKHGRIHSIDVDPAHQRQGIATALWEYANKRPGMKPKHSPDRTNAGEAWARSVSSRLPALSRPTMAQILEESGAGPGQGRRGPVRREELANRISNLTTRLHALQEFHGTTHNEEDHGRRGDKKVRVPSFNTSVVPKDKFKVIRTTDTPAPGADNPLAVRGSRGESGTEPERRIPHRGETVDIYRDLGRGREFKRGFPDKAAFSVRNAASVDGNSSALVKASTVGIVLDQPRPSWAAAAKREAEATGKRGVHAFIRGEVSEYLSPDEANELISQPGWQEVTYYPGTQDFFDPKTRRRFLAAKKAVGVNGKFYVMGPEFHETTTPVSEIEKKIQASMAASGFSIDDPEWWEYDRNVELRMVELWARARALQQFHLESHDEKSHGRRGVNKVTKKGSDKVFVPTVKKKGSTAEPTTPAAKKAAFTPTVKKKETPAPVPKVDLPPPAPDPAKDVIAPSHPKPERPTLTPPAEKASVSPVTNDLANKTPSEIDTELFPLWADRWDTAVKRHEYVEMLEKHEQAKAGAWEPRNRYDRSPLLDSYTASRYQEKVAEFDAKLAEIRAKMEPFEDEFKRRGGWERCDFVPDGHLHRRGCYTLYPTTERLLLAEASGRSDEWIVDNFAYAACTVCFPTAPVEAREKYLSDRKKASQDEREAKRAAKAAKEAEKNLVEPVKVSFWGTVHTVSEARSRLKGAVEDRVFKTEETYWTDQGDIARRQAEREEDIRILSEALARKGFDVEAMIEKYRKAAEKEKAR